MELFDTALASFIAALFRPFLRIAAPAPVGLGFLMQLLFVNIDTVFSFKSLIWALAKAICFVFFSSLGKCVR